MKTKVSQFPRPVDPYLARVRALEAEGLDTSDAQSVVDAEDMKAASAQHTRGALHLAEILIPEGIDREGRPSRIATTYGSKTREGIADMIDRETAAPKLLAALRAALPCVEKVVSEWDEIEAGKSRIFDKARKTDQAMLVNVRAAIAEAEKNAP